LQCPEVALNSDKANLVSKKSFHYLKGYTKVPTNENHKLVRPNPHEASTLIQGVQKMVHNKNINNYFHRVASETPTEFWINTANLTDLGLGLMAGAVGNTSNPGHLPQVIKTESEIWYPIIDEILHSDPELSDDQVADLVVQRVVSRILKLLQPLYEESNGKYGYVAIQSNPRVNHVLEDVVKSGITYSKLGKNVAVKVVSTGVGPKALEELTARGINTIATNGFSVAQAIDMAEAYEKGLKRTDKKPKCLVVHIAGIFDEYLTELAEKENISISPEYIHQTGVAVSRAVYRVFQERGFKCMLIGGGARQPHHFTELVGGDLAITISAYTVKDLLAEDPPVVSRIDAETAPEILAELEKRFPDFRQAYYPDGLAPDEFRDFGPCIKFQNMFLKGYAETVAEIQARRAAIGAKSRKVS